MTTRGKQKSNWTMKRRKSTKHQSCQTIPPVIVAMAPVRIAALPVVPRGLVVRQRAQKAHIQLAAVVSVRNLRLTPGPIFHTQPTSPSLITASNKQQGLETGVCGSSLIHILFMSIYLMEDQREHILILH